MFESPEYPKSLDESVFTNWLETGRKSPIPYTYLLVIWDELDRAYKPVYTQSRSELNQFPRYGSGTDQRVLVAAYDLYSESRLI